MPSFTVPLLIVIGFFLLLFLSLRLMGGFAPGWVVRCRKCGKVRKADEAGVLRVGSISSISYTIDWCSECRRLRWHVVERESTERR
jgi:hypothetical protein